MAAKGNCIHSPGSAPWPGEPTSGPERKDWPDAADAGNGDYEAMVEQGLRLNRAFIRIKDPFVREAVVNLVVEAAKNEGGAETLSAGQGLFRRKLAEIELLRGGLPDLRPSPSGAPTRRPPRT